MKDFLIFSIKDNVCSFIKTTGESFLSKDQGLKLIIDKNEHQNIDVNYYYGLSGKAGLNEYLIEVIPIAPNYHEMTLNDILKNKTTDIAKDKIYSGIYYEYRSNDHTIF